MVAGLICELFVDAIILSAAILIAAALARYAVKLARRLSHWQTRPVIAMLRLAVVTAIILVGMPWFLERLATCMHALLQDVQHFVG